ncbi:hypothetical protein [uncultured Psychrobacter sp.]|uniref:hypothetical protein n=1 Tax=uncultured Psychrobacter sp. TaxID=259303 RepID=UPI003457CF19
MIKYYELSDARLMSEKNVFSRIEIIPCEAEGYKVGFVEDKDEYSFLKAQRGNVRYFKTLDSAFNTVKSLGYDECKLVVVSKNEDE